MDDFNTETDSDYTSYWRDWVSQVVAFVISLRPHVRKSFGETLEWVVGTGGKHSCERWLS
jgi:hypothetical protein